MRKFQEFHPVTLLVYFLLVLIPIMFLMEIRLTLVSMMGGILVLWYYQKKFPFQTLYFSLGAAFFFTLMNGLLVHEGATELFFINGKAITLQSLFWGLKTGLMLGSGIMWFGILSILMTSEKILSLFRRLPKTGLLLSMVIKMIPSYLDQYREIRMVAKINGNATGKEREDAMKAMSSVFTWALENSMQTAESMNMRGYGARKRIFSMEVFGRRDGIFLGFMLITQAMYLLDGWLRLLSYGLFFTLPLLYAGKERLKWELYSWKK